MKRSASILYTGLMTSMVLVGCSAAVTGGDTECSDFLGQDDKTQNEAVGKMLKDEKGAEATNLEIGGTRLAVTTYCQTAGKQDTPIKQAPHL